MPRNKVDVSAKSVMRVNAVWLKGLIKVCAL